MASSSSTPSPRPPDATRPDRPQPPLCPLSPRLTESKQVPLTRASDQSPNTTIRATSTIDHPEYVPQTHSIVADCKGLIRSAYTTFAALSTAKKIVYGIVTVSFTGISVALAVLSQHLQRNLHPLATRMESSAWSWAVLSLLIALVSVPPLFGHELLGVVAGYVYGQRIGFLILTLSSLAGESGVYFAFRRFLRGRIHAFRVKYRANYGIFVGVVEDGGLTMLFLIRMSVIPPHFSTPLFAGLESITWTRWMLANVLASPVRMFPPVFIGSLLRDSKSNSVLGDVAFVFSSLITFAVLWTIRKRYLVKKDELDLARVRASRSSMKFEPQVTVTVKKPVLGRDLEEADITTAGSVSHSAARSRTSFENSKPLDHAPMTEVYGPKRPTNFSRPARMT